jgi:hypothetical protein
VQLLHEYFAVVHAENICVKNKRRRGRKKTTTHTMDSECAEEAHQYESNITE